MSKGISALLLNVTLNVITESRAALTSTSHPLFLSNGSVPSTISNVASLQVFVWVISRQIGGHAPAGPRVKGIAVRCHRC